MTMDYDEDLSTNPFLVDLQQKFADLYSDATRNKYMICVPCKASLSTFDGSRCHFESHVLKAVPAKPGRFITVNYKEISISNMTIKLGSGFSTDSNSSVSVLFEETYFNENDESYIILCISQPLEGTTETFSLEHRSDVISFDDCARQLWGHLETASDKLRTKQLLEKTVRSFLTKVEQLNSESLQNHVDLTHELYTQCLRIVTKNMHLKCEDLGLLESVSQAVETYMMHAVYKTLFRSICSCVAARDAKMNKITRNLRHIQLRDIGVRSQFCPSIPRARRELSNLAVYHTPFLKLKCLKRVADAFTMPASQQNCTENWQALNSDDLLVIFVFLVIKADMPNWYANFEFMKHFRFMKMTSNDKFGFYLASLEAALEHVLSNRVMEMLSSADHRTSLSSASTENFNGISSASDSLWQRQDSDSSAVNRFLECVRQNNVAAAREMLTRDVSGAPCREKLEARLCHPLCTCAKCRPLVGAIKQEVERAHVSVNSRNELGSTALHIAALHDHVGIVDVLVGLGANTNLSDYQGFTPLHIACQKGRQRISLLLLHYGAEVNAKDNSGNTPLHLSTANAHHDCVKALLYHDQGSAHLNVNAQNDFGDTPLHIAAKWGFTAIVSSLLENGADSTVFNRQRLTAVNVAHNARMSRMLTEASVQHQTIAAQKTEVIPCNQTEMPSAHNSAMAKGHTNKGQKVAGGSRTVRFDLKSEASRKTKSTQERQIDKLLRCTADGDTEMVKFLLGWTEEESGDEEEDEGHQLCHPLCQCEDCEPLQKRILRTSQRLHVGSANAAGFSALHVAAQFGHEDTALLLLEHGADVNVQTALRAYTPLHLACKYSQPKVVRVILKYGAKINLTDSSGKVPLELCKENSKSEIRACFEQVMWLSSSSEQSVPLPCVVNTAETSEVDLVNLEHPHSVLLNHTDEISGKQSASIAATSDQTATTSQTSVLGKFLEETATEVSAITISTTVEGSATDMEPEQTAAPSPTLVLEKCQKDTATEVSAITTFTPVEGSTTDMEPEQTAAPSQTPVLEKCPVNTTTEVSAIALSTSVEGSATDMEPEQTETPSQTPVLEKCPENTTTEVSAIATSTPVESSATDMEPEQTATPSQTAVLEKCPENTATKVSAITTSTPVEGSATDVEPSSGIISATARNDNVPSVHQVLYSVANSACSKYEGTKKALPTADSSSSVCITTKATTVTTATCENFTATCEKGLSSTTVEENGGLNTVDVMTFVSGASAACSNEGSMASADNIQCVLADAQVSNLPDS